MSELKVHVKPLKTNVLGQTIVGQSYYLKSEADKVIAELKAQKAQAEDDCAYWKMSEGNAANAMHETEEYAMQLYREAQHHKYKRCLAMADMNWWQANRYSAAEMVERIRGNFEEATQCSKLEEKYLKRYNKWLALAEKFKEAK